MSCLVMIAQAIQNRMYEGGLGACETFCHIYYHPAVIRPTGGWNAR